MTVFDFLHQEVREQEQANTKHVETAAKQAKDIAFLHDEIDDCASHYYEEVREHKDDSAKLAASAERVKEMEQAVEVS